LGYIGWLARGRVRQANAEPKQVIAPERPHQDFLASWFPQRPRLVLRLAPGGVVA